MAVVSLAKAGTAVVPLAVLEVPRKAAAVSVVVASAFVNPPTSACPVP